MGFQLQIKVITGIKTVAGIELVMVFAVAALDLTVMARSIRTNEFMSDTELRSSCLEQSWLVL